ncbi:hypothetical protein B0F90DRAFT_1727852 [Multifurca ochricompacta]|uniref:Uncharacterized protein n=1 Tax=Multifurca ochricompacta TaxID=376703 RepID=A0AAD4M4K3_9AGAM|nr:hypothetical protein B0F90DRAFT_1727852 [Multifurca ochricompacta]
MTVRKNWKICIVYCCAARITRRRRRRRRMKTQGQTGLIYKIAAMKKKNGMRTPPSTRFWALRNRNFIPPPQYSLANNETICREYSEEKLLQMLSRAFADASQGLREDVVLSLRPLLSSIRNARATPGRPFITGLLGFDDVCKRFEKSSSAWNVELEGAYAKIEVETRQLFERLQTAYSRIDERYIAFEAQMKEQSRTHPSFFAFTQRGLTANFQSE